MKKRMYSILAAVALLLTGAAGVGSSFMIIEEPTALDFMID